MQEVRRFAAATVARWMTVVAGFYRICVIDGVIDHSPADYALRPIVSNESSTPGPSHLQFEALLTAARDPTKPYDFALVVMLGLLGLPISEDEEGHRMLRLVGKGAKVVLVPMPPAIGRAVDRAVPAREIEPILLNSWGQRMDRHCATRQLRASRLPRRWCGCSGCIRILRGHRNHLLTTEPPDSLRTMSWYGDNVEVMGRKLTAGRTAESATRADEVSAQDRLR